MSTISQKELEKFSFRKIHPQVLIGMASDRYAGWLGQIYSRELYHGRISRRAKVIAGKSLTEEILPIDSVKEYFKHFPVLEIDFTFYRPLVEKNGKPTQNFHVLQKYREYLKESDSLLLKVPQVIMATKLRKEGASRENPDYLDAEVFARQFYEPANGLLGPHLKGFIFEQEYQRQQDRAPVKDLARNLDGFFQKAPRDPRYHVELRTDLYLREPVFEVLAKHGVGQVLSHWTWLPPLRKQLAKAGRRFFNKGGQSIIRLLTPLGMGYEDSYLKAYPFDRLKEEMLQPEMLVETVDLMRAAVADGVMINVIVNNRAGGNAPLIAQRLVEKFLGKLPQKPKQQLRLW